MTRAATAVEHVDVLVVGAGISGIGAAYHLQKEGGRSFLVLDALESYGGTWWTHKYPGVRSDSDLFTFGYGFKPWRGAPIASGEEILRYLGEVIEENHLDGAHPLPAPDHRRELGHRPAAVDGAGQRTDTGEELTVTCGFLWMCQGYYRHATPYTPEWEGMDRFRGPVVHPQQWPADLDVTGKRVVVVGSGATAATLVPALAGTAAHVTMLQRTPTFFFTRPKVNELAEQLRALEIPDEWTHEIMRRSALKMGAEITAMAAEHPDMVREALVQGAREQLPEGFDVDKHFNPPYRPWQQRIALLPEGDLFTCIREGTASVATDAIAEFTEDGIRLGSGEVLEADVVVTATGFDLSVLGDLPLTVDGQRVDPASTVTYRGLMFTGVPNLATVFGYFRSSWTLRADLISAFVCRLLGEMDAKGASMVVPEVPEADRDMALGPWVDPEEFNPGYLTRSLHLMPRQGDRAPWRLLHDYAEEREVLPAADLDDGTLVYK